MYLKCHDVIAGLLCQTSIFVTRLPLTSYLYIEKTECQTVVHMLKNWTSSTKKKLSTFGPGEGGVQTFVSNTVISSLGIPVLMLKLELFIFMYRLSCTYLPAYIRTIWPRSPAISGRFVYWCALYSVSSCMRGKWGRVFIAFSMFFPHSPIPWHPNLVLAGIVRGSGGKQPEPVSDFLSLPAASHYQTRIGTFTFTFPAFGCLSFIINNPRPFFRYFGLPPFLVAIFLYSYVIALAI